MSDPLFDAYQQKSDGELMDFARSLQQETGAAAPPTPGGKPLTVGEAAPKAAAVQSVGDDTSWRGVTAETAAAGRALVIGGKVTYESAMSAINRALGGLHQFAFPPSGAMTAAGAKERLQGLGNILAGVAGIPFAPVAGGAQALMTPILERYPWLKDYKLAEGATAQAMRDALSGGMPVLAPGLGLVVIRPTDAVGGKPFGYGGRLGQQYNTLEEYAQSAEPLMADEALHAAVSTALVLGAAKFMEQTAPEPATKPGQKAAPSPATPTSQPGAAPAIGGGAASPAEGGQIGFEPNRLAPVDAAQLEKLKALALDESTGTGMPTEAPRAFGINWERLGTSDSLKRVTLGVQEQIRKTQEAFATSATGEVSSQGYGAIKQTHAMTKQQAAANPFSLNDVLEGRFFRPGDTIDIMAARFTALKSLRDGMAHYFQDQVHLAASGDELAKADLPATAALHQLVADRTYRFQSAIARAQESGKIVTDPMLGPVPTQSVEAFIRNITGQMDGETIAKNYMALEKQQGAAAAQSWMKNTFASAGNMAWEYFIGAKLSSPTTWAKKAISDAATMAYNIEQRGLMRVLHQVFWPDDPTGTQAGAVGALTSGYEKSVMDTLRAAAPKRLGGQGQPLGDLPGVQHWEREPAIAAKTLNIRGAQDFIAAAESGDVGAVAASVPGAAMDVVGQGVRLGGNVLKGTTEIAQAINFGAEVRANANNLARIELAGKVNAPNYSALVKARIAEIEANLDQFPMVTGPAAEAAQRLTYTQPLGPTGQMFTGWLNSIPSGRVNMPFVNIPINLAKEAGHLFPPTWLASRFIWGEMKNDWAKGGVYREAAAAKLANGILISTGVGLLVSGGKMTGMISKDPALVRQARDAGVTPYTLYPTGSEAGDQGIQGYHLIAPFGIAMGAMADTMELIGQLPPASNEAERAAQILGSTAIALAYTVKNEPMLMGASEFFDTMSQPDRGANQWLTQFVRGLVPTGLQRFNHAYLDQHIKEIRGPLDALQAAAGMPGVIDRRDVIDGQPILYPPGVGPDIVSPFTWSEIPTEKPVQRQLWQDQIKVSRFPWVVAGSREPANFVRLQPPTAAEGVPLEPAQRDRWIELTTSLRYGGRTQEEALLSLMNSSGYKSLPAFPDNQSRSAAVHTVISAYRSLAMNRLRQEDRPLDLAMRMKERTNLTNRLPTTSPLSTGTKPTGATQLIPGLR